jgi:excisionase family DNA binding protein
MLSATQTAQALGLSRARIHQLITAGKLKATRVGHVWIVTPQDLEAFKATRNPKPEPDHVR